MTKRFLPENLKLLRGRERRGADARNPRRRAARVPFPKPSYANGARSPPVRSPAEGASSPGFLLHQILTLFERAVCPVIAVGYFSVFDYVEAVDAEFVGFFEENGIFIVR